MVKNGKESKRFDRISILAIVIFILTCFLILRLFNIQVLRGAVYTAMASGQHKLFQSLHPTRGEIFIFRKDYDINDNLYPIVANDQRHEVYAIPSDIKNPVQLSRQVGEILGLNPENLEPKFRKEDDPYEPVYHYAADQQVEALKALENSGLNFVPEELRLYPEKNIYSHITGFLGYEEDERVGQYGLEGSQEEILAGAKGQISLEADLLGNWIPTSKKNILKKAVDGSDLVLTIDNPIQFFTCQALEQSVLKYGADSGSITVMNPKTGAILAMCGYPNYDPNNYSKVESIDVYENQVVTVPYEPGSIFKAVTMAAALDTGSVTPETTYEDTGQVKIDVYTIKNSDLKAHGECNMVKVLEESLNTGAIFAMRETGQDKFREYIKNFGFGASTGIEIGPEAVANISSLDKPGEIYAATASYGQGITVTPIQMLTSFTALANHGILVKPYLIAKIINPDGSITETQTQEIGQPITAETAAKISAMLVSTIKNGHSGKAGVKGYYVAGKTGTAQVPKKEERGYSKAKTIHSFIGFAPVDDPVFVALVKLDHVKNVRFSADSAAPVFGNLARFILNYYEIPPDED